MPWNLSLNPNKIEVEGWDVDYAWGSALRGEYNLLPDNCCKKCAYPEPTWMCSNHDDLYGFDRIFAVGKYISFPWGYLLSDHIRYFKKQSGFREPLGEALYLAASSRYPEILEYEFLVPVPMHKSKRLERGYNQAEILGLEFSSYTDIPLIDCLSQKRKIELRGKKRAERLEEVRGAFDFKPEFSEEIKGKRTLLIDDVVTTGGTASECSHILKKAGASQICVYVLGRTCDE